MQDEHFDANWKMWNERAAFHVKTAFYDLDGFVAGERTGLHPTEPNEMGSVAGKSLVQLQCHLGIETLAWARLGASHVVGLDFAPEAITAARSLAERCGLSERAKFVVSDVHDAPRALESWAPFDIVYVSVGALIWLPSVRRWAEICSALIKPGGRLYLREVHPMLAAIREQAGQLLVDLPYFELAAPTKDDDPGTYADPTAVLEHRISYSWNRGLGEIIQALLDVGFQLELLHEHRDAEWQAFPQMQLGEHNLYRLPKAQSENLPLTFSLRARKHG